MGDKAKAAAIRSLMKIPYPLRKINVSLSGGQTSAYMAKAIWDGYKDECEIVFTFANTGQEKKECFDFIQACSDAFGFPVVWLEADVYHGRRKSTGFTEVTSETANDTGEPFEEVIKKYGLPNMAYPHCTRELKINPMKALSLIHI